MRILTDVTNTKSLAESGCELSERDGYEADSDRWKVNWTECVEYTALEMDAFKVTLGVGGGGTRGPGLSSVTVRWGGG